MLFCLLEIGCWGEPVCLHLHPGPPHLDQPAVLGGHFLRRGPEPDQRPVPQQPGREVGHRCQAEGKMMPLLDLGFICSLISLISFNPC